MSLLSAKNLNPQHPGKGIVERKLPYANLLISLALESSLMKGFGVLGFGVRESTGENEGELGRRMN